MCLNLLDDPTTLPCGHSGCMKCLSRHLDLQDGGQVYTCPTCKEIFLQKPALVQNSMLALVVEQLKVGDPGGTPASLRYKPQADESRPRCRTSDCDGHVPPHLSVPAPRRHRPADGSVPVTRRRPLSSVVEDLKKAGQREAPVQSGSVPCDMCTDGNQKAVKSCLQCLVSFCQDHLRPHLSVPALRKHRLVEVSAHLQQSVCSKHQEVMKLFCRTDQCCICYLCSKDAHKGHDKVSAAAERAEKQLELRATRRTIQQRIGGKKNELELFQQEEDSLHRSADTVLRNIEETSREHVAKLQKSLSDLKDKIKSQQATEGGRLRKAREKLERDIAVLKKTDADLETLSSIDEPTYFLMGFKSLASLPPDPPAGAVRRVRHFDRLMDSVFVAREKLEEVLGEECAKMSMALVKAPPPSPGPEPRTREDFLRYACHVSLDPDTANPHLSLSEGNRKVVFTRAEQDYPAHPERFAYSWQVLSKQSLAGRCYLEVERNGKGALVAVAYKSICRAGNFSDCVFGNNDKSWALDCFKNSYEFVHDKVKTAIAATWSPRVGVYLDRDEGVLSFYSISDTMTLLRKVQTTFTEPLHAGIWLAEGATAELKNLQADR